MPATRLAPFACVFVLAACQTAGNYTPTIDPATAPRAGRTQQQDIFECRQIAMQDRAQARAGERALQGGVGGAVAGGVIGSMDGNFGSGALIGAGSGAVLGGVLGAFEGTEEEKSILRNCLEGRGYRVLD